MAEMASQSPAPPENVKAAESPEKPDEGASTGVSSDKLKIMKGIVDYLTDYKDANGHEVTRDFQRMLNKRLIPDYFQVIKEPTAFSTIRAKILKKQYKSFREFVRDFALISHNAQVYNRPSAPVYSDAIALRELVKMEIAKLVDKSIVTAEEAEFPDLGEIPPVEDSPPPGPDEEEVEDDEDDEDEDEDEDDSDDDRPRRGRGRRSRPKREGSKVDDSKDDPESRKVRGRPPRVLTPMEARISTILKSLRKFKNPGGDLKILPFERLPDKTTMPDYFQEIKNPIAMDLIKRKAKRKKYQSVDAAMKDLELMFENAKQYNLEESQIYKDAVGLQREAQLLAEQEKKKPDSDFADEDGRLPLSEILHNGEIWKVGDWVHIQNPNDLTKPIVAQIYRTWQDPEGQKWINACWYYRPEQTVHRYEKHFFENEVVKTGRYQDHQIDEIVDRCFVMFFTRFNKGRPRGFPPDKEVYVCEARYNEEKFKLNKIKTWASCVPDEVRDKDYEMDLFDAPRRMRKVPSPIKHLLQEDAREDDPLPKPTWGAANAPPIVGAVHKRPREANESPPPEPTPSPSPPPPEPARPSTISGQADAYGRQGDVSMSNTQHTAPSSSSKHQAQGSYGQQFGPSRSSATPVPPLHRQNSYGSHSNSHQNSVPPTTPFNGQQSANFSSYQSGVQNTQTPNPLASHIPHQTQSQSQSQAHSVSQSNYTAPVPTPSHLHATTAHRSSISHASSTNAYNPPRQVEVYHLSDNANLNIPADIRAQFHRDEYDRVLFFTAPPLDISPLPSSARNLGHSVRYLAKKAKDRAAKSGSGAVEDDNGGAVKSGIKRKREAAETGKDSELQELKAKALRVLGEKIELGTEMMYKGLYGPEWTRVKEADEARLAEMQEQDRKIKKLIERHEREREAETHIRIC
ncbi:MAG: hypothetical protein M1818_003154 [Claussenomyces sp. TS43310]|nr:MAG: hypothetical protein M1818_003154 [Claussenomyces sp. TS43310]